jgi:hypothetical protein
LCLLKPLCFSTKLSTTLFDFCDSGDMAFFIILPDLALHCFPSRMVRLGLGMNPSKPCYLPQTLSSVQAGRGTGPCHTALLCLVQPHFSSVKEGGGDAQPFSSVLTRGWGEGTSDDRLARSQSLLEPTDQPQATELDSEQAERVNTVRVGSARRRRRGRSEAPGRFVAVRSLSREGARHARPAITLFSFLRY